MSKISLLNISDLTGIFASRAPNFFPNLSNICPSCTVRVGWLLSHQLFFARILLFTVCMYVCMVFLTCNSAVRTVCVCVCVCVGVWELDQGQTAGTSWPARHNRGGIWTHTVVCVCLLFNLDLRHYFFSSGIFSLFSMHTALLACNFTSGTRLIQKADTHALFEIIQYVNCSVHLWYDNVVWSIQCCYRKSLTWTDFSNVTFC